MAMSLVHMSLSISHNAMLLLPTSTYKHISQQLSMQGTGVMACSHTCPCPSAGMQRSCHQQAPVRPPLQPLQPLSMQGVRLGACSMHLLLDNTASQILCLLLAFLAGKKPLQANLVSLLCKEQLQCSVQMTQAVGVTLQDGKVQESAKQPRQ